MQPVYETVLRCWSIPPVVTAAIVLSAVVYLRGWWFLWRAGVPFLRPWKAVAFLSGLCSIWVALASPIDALNDLMLTAHMLQHMLLMMVAPPLILLGAPLIPIVRGLPILVARKVAGPFLNWSVVVRLGRTLTNPVVAALLMGVAMFAWHTPNLYELALRSSSWHDAEHASFFVTSLIFWWPVVLPWPSRGQWPRWAMVPYLLVADLQNTALSAILAFSERVLYRSYSTVPRLFGWSALEDQVAAGAFMWVVGSLVFVVPAAVLAVQCLSMRSPDVRRQGSTCI
jgi:cytochrome c oxidase assembly factor CtaG